MTNRQRDVVFQLLQERGAVGVSAKELIYEHGITRAAAIIHLLRREEWNIETRQLPGQTAVYILHGRKEQRQQRLWGEL